MPHGFSKRKDSAGIVEWIKTHRNGEQTRINIEQIPNADRWFAFVEDEGLTEELGRFASKAEAETAAKNWMKRNPKGIQSQGNPGGGFLPGMNGAQQSNDFFG